MKTKIHFSLLYLLITTLFTACGNKQSKLTPQQVEDMVAEAYVHCFPIVENYKAIYFYAILEQSPKFAPFNTFNNKPRLYTAEDVHVVSANNDTYYDNGALDLRAEPVVIKVPDANGRYYVYQLVSMTTDNFSYVGTRLRGDKAATYAITSPSFKGTLPSGVVEIKSPSDFVCVVGRIGVDANSLEDQELAKEFYHQVEIGPISKFYPQFKAEEVEPIKNWPVYSEKTLTTDEFFSTLNFLLPFIKLSSDEQPIIDKYAAIGIKSGEAYTFLQNNPAFKNAVEAGIKKGIAKVDELANNVGNLNNGWQLWPILPTYFGNDYDLRAAIARLAIYANCPEEAYYPSVRADKDRQLLNGKNSYSITFPAGQLPPAKFFWSLTMYDAQTQLMVANPLNRYSIGDRTKAMKYNTDSSLTLYFGSKPPKEGTSNWLPAPEGNFYMLMRIYGPKEEVLKGTWHPEPVVKINK